MEVIHPLATGDDLEAKASLKFDHAPSQSVLRAAKVGVVNQRRKETKGSEIGVVESIEEVCFKLEIGGFVQMEKAR